MREQQEQHLGVGTAEELFRRGSAEIGKVIVGQTEAVAQALATLLCGGHALVEGVPGLAKTLTVKTLGRALGLEFRRVQGTPDMMPGDILGTTVFTPAFEGSAASFRFHPGPVFTQFLLADEVNRMPPRTQAALLESMEERQVTADGVRHPLDTFFTVFATQNPVEFEGTYPLPEAQLDRFLLKIALEYPSAEEERVMLERQHTSVDPAGLDATPIAAVPAEILVQARREVRGVQVEDALMDYLLAAVRRTREWPAISLGASPRASVSLLLVAKALAARDGRDYVLPDDVKEAAVPVLRHRLVLRPEAELEGLSPDRVIREVLQATPVPK